MSAVDKLKVLADWDRDGLWGHALSDITARVITAQWSYGFDAPGQFIAPPAQGMITLDNHDGAFNTGLAASTYGPLLQNDVLIQFQHTGGVTLAGYDLTPFAVTVLRVVDVRFERSGGSTVILTLGDWHDDLMRIIYDPPFTENVTTGVAAAAPFQGGLIPLSYAGQYFIVDAAELDTTTALFIPGNAYASFYLGSTTLDYVGDNIDRGNGVSLYSFLEELCRAEMDGRFWLETWPGPASEITYDPRPRWRFMGRQDLSRYYDAQTAAPIPASFFLRDGSEYEFSKTLCNSLDLTVFPRTVGTPGSELARNGSPIRLRAGESKQLTLRYRDPDYPDGTCSATTIITPVASNDYTANAEQDGSGADMTSSITVSAENRTSAAYINIVYNVPASNSTPDVYVTLLKVRGTPITARQPIILTSKDAPSIKEYGLAAEARTISGVDDLELAQSYADFYVQQHKDPVSRYRRVTFEFPEVRGTDEYYAALTVPLRFGGVKITDDWVEDEPRPQWVAGAAHVVNMSGRTWRTTWFMEDFTQQAVWTIGDTAIGLDGQFVETGFSKLDISTRLGF